MTLYKLLTLATNQPSQAFVQPYVLTAGGPDAPLEGKEILSVEIDLNRKRV